MALVLPSCGVLMMPASFAVPVETRPPGALVVYEGRPVGVTPCEVCVTRASPRFELQLEGFHRQVVDVGVTRNWWVAGNVVTLGLGAAVDVAAGADKIPDTDLVTVYLVGSDGPVPWTWLRFRPGPEWPPPESDDLVPNWVRIRRDRALPRPAASLVGFLLQLAVEALVKQPWR